MARVQIPFSFSYPSGTLYAAAAFNGSPNTTINAAEPVVGTTVTITNRTTLSPATVYLAETGGSTISLVQTDAGGNVPGWLDPGSYKLVAASQGAFAGATINFEAVRGDGVTNISPGAVGTTQIASGAVGATQIASGAVGTTQIASGAVGATQIARGAARMKTVAQNTGPYTASNGDLVLAQLSTGWTMTLPAPSVDAVVGAAVWSVVGGGQQLTIAAAGGAAIYGPGVNGVSSILLGAQGAFVVLESDGLNWFTIAGQQDTGPVNVTLGNNTLGATGTYFPTARLIGDRVFLRGTLRATAGIGAGTTLATLPASMCPSGPIQCCLSEGTAGSQTPQVANISTGGAITLVVSGMTTNATLALDGVNYTLA